MLPVPPTPRSTAAHRFGEAASTTVGSWAAAPRCGPPCVRPPDPCRSPGARVNVVAPLDVSGWSARCRRPLGRERTNFTGTAVPASRWAPPVGVPRTVAPAAHHPLSVTQAKHSGLDETGKTKPSD